MTRVRFAEEFREDAVWQVIERGYTVTDVANRLGASPQSLYKWVKAVRPIDEDKAELAEVKRENLRLWLNWPALMKSETF
jgi:transposase